MSKGGGQTRTVTTSTRPPEYAQPYLEYGLSEAKRLYGEQPQYFPGSTTVGFSPESEMALAATRERAMAGTPFAPARQGVVMQNLMGTNPLQAAAFRPVVEQIEGQASKAGRYGSGYQQAAVAQALAPAALQAQQAAIGQVPGAYEFGFADLGKLAGVGAAREAQQQAELAADIERFQFEQQQPLSSLANYMAAVQGGTIGGDKITPYFRQPGLSALGGALSGYQLGEKFGMGGLGAGLGGLLGLMG